MMINKLILGTVQMGLSYGINNKNGKISSGESQTILEDAYIAGIRTLDTAEVYGEAHRLIGTYHKNSPGNKFNIITKLSADINTKNIKNKVYRYLNELNVEKLHSLMFHSFDTYKSQTDLVDVILQLKSDGLLINVGVSVYTNQEVETLLKDGRIDLIQLPFNLLDNHTQKGELLVRAKKKGKTVHTRSAFLQGLFFKDIHESNPIVESLREELKMIHNLVKKYGTDIASLALQYCLHQSYIDQVLIGVDSVSQLKQNINAGNQNFNTDILNEIDNIIVKNQKYLNPSNWQTN